MIAGYKNSFVNFVFCALLPSLHIVGTNLIFLLWERSFDYREKWECRNKGVGGGGGRGFFGYSVRGILRRRGAPRLGRCHLLLLLLVKCVASPLKLSTRLSSSDCRSQLPLAAESNLRSNTGFYVLVRTTRSHPRQADTNRQTSRQANIQTERQTERQQMRRKNVQC
jgi:hypothetical protein